MCPGRGGHTITTYHWHTFGRLGRIDLLLEADVFGEVLLDGMGHGKRSEALLHVTLDDMLQCFWEQEEVGLRKMLSVENEECERQYEETTKRGSDGKYIVRRIYNLLITQERLSRFK